MVSIDFNESAKRWKRYSEEYYSESRSNYLDVIKGSNTVAAALIGFNVIWLQIKSKPSTLQKSIFLASVITLGISILLGLLAQKESAKFMIRVGTAYESRSNAMYEHMLSTHNSTGAKYPKEVDDIKVQDTFSPWQQKWQSKALFLGVAVSTLFAIMFVL